MALAIWFQVSSECTGKFSMYIYPVVLGTEVLYVSGSIGKLSMYPVVTGIYS